MFPPPQPPPRKTAPRPPTTTVPDLTSAINAVSVAEPTSYPARSGLSQQNAPTGYYSPTTYAQSLTYAQRTMSQSSGIPQNLAYAQRTMSQSTGTYPPTGTYQPTNTYQPTSTYQPPGPYPQAGPYPQTGSYQPTGTYQPAGMYGQSSLDPARSVQRSSPAPRYGTPPAPAQRSSPAPRYGTPPAPAQRSSPAPRYGTPPAPAQRSSPAPNPPTAGQSADQTGRGGSSRGARRQHDGAVPQAAGSSKNRRYKGDVWTPEDDNFLEALHNSRMSWKDIAEYFPGRTESACRSRFYNALKEGGRYWKANGPQSR